HTRSYGDWSSDVCTSDLTALVRGGSSAFGICQAGEVSAGHGGVFCGRVLGRFEFFLAVAKHFAPLRRRIGHDLFAQHFAKGDKRSEERRVGKEWGEEWGQ